MPIAIVEVKQPGLSKMKNKKVFDYMCNLHNSFGQCEVFGIVTTLEHWRVCWLPVTNNFAALTTFVPQQYIGREKEPKHEVMTRILLSNQLREK